MLNIFEGVDTSSLDNMAWALAKIIGLFLLVPSILGGVVGIMLRAKRRTIGFLIGLFGLIGLYILFTNFDDIYNWLS